MSEEHIGPDDLVEEELLDAEDMPEPIEPDESDLDVDDDGEGEPEEQAAPKVDPAEHQRLRNEEAARNLQSQMQQRAIAEAREYEYVNSLDYDQRNAYFVEKQRRMAIAQILQAQDQADRAAFAKSAADRGLSKTRINQVESVVAEARRRGGNMTREEAFWLVRGQALAEREKRGAAPAGDRPSPVARRRGQSRQEAQDEALLRGLTFGEASRHGLF